MKKILTTTTAALAALILAGCTFQVTAPSTAEPAQAPEPPAQTQTLKERGLELLREEFPKETRGVSDSTITDVAGAACEMLDAGGTFEQFILLGVREGIDAGFAGAIFAYAVAVECPENADKIPSN